MKGGVVKREMERGERLPDAGDRIGWIISLNLENCENPLWVLGVLARVGQLTTGKLDFAGAKGETGIESVG